MSYSISLKDLSWWGRSSWLAVQLKFPIQGWFIPGVWNFGRSCLVFSNCHLCSRSLLSHYIYNPNNIYENKKNFECWNDRFYYPAAGVTVPVASIIKIVYVEVDIICVKVYLILQEQCMTSLGCYMANLCVPIHIHTWYFIWIHSKKILQIHK